MKSDLKALEKALDRAAELSRKHADAVQKASAVMNMLMERALR